MYVSEIIRVNGYFPNLDKFEDVNLSPSKTGVFDSVLKGLKNTNIATVCKISIKTVEKHKRELFCYFDVKNSYELITKKCKKNDLFC